MTSVINSARNSSASVFDFVGSVANVSNQLISTAARSVDALDAKAQLMHRRVVTNARAQMVVVEDDEITKAATEHTDLMEEIHKRNYPNKEFDRQAFFQSALEKIQAAVHEAA